MQTLFQFIVPIENLCVANFFVGVCVPGVCIPSDNSFKNPIAINIVGHQMFAFAHELPLTFAVLKMLTNVCPSVLSVIGVSATKKHRCLLSWNNFVLQVPIAIVLAMISFNEGMTWKMGVAASMIVLTAILEQLDHLRRS